jgi:hypothetical protein
VGGCGWLARPDLARAQPAGQACQRRRCAQPRASQPPAAVHVPEHACLPVPRTPAAAERFPACVTPAGTPPVSHHRPNRGQQPDPRATTADTFPARSSPQDGWHAPIQTPGTLPTTNKHRPAQHSKANPGFCNTLVRVNCASAVTLQRAPALAACGAGQPDTHRPSQGVSGGTSWPVAASRADSGWHRHPEPLGQQPQVVPVGGAQRVAKVMTDLQLGGSGSERSGPRPCPRRAAPRPGIRPRRRRQTPASHCPAGRRPPDAGQPAGRRRRPGPAVLASRASRSDRAGTPHGPASLVRGRSRHGR